MTPRAKLLTLIEGRGIDDLTLEQLGKMCGVTRERIRQILRELGITKTRLIAHLHGNRNPAWREGSRLFDSHGYVRVVARTHHLADSRGYVLEHRLIAEQKLGRRLESNEVVHHIDGDRTNNHPDNLTVCASVGAHIAKFHRQWYDRNRKVPAC